MSGVVLDSSAVIALIADEPEAPRLAAALDRLTDRVIGAPTLVETGIVLRARYGGRGELALDAFLQRFDVRVVPLATREATFAREAHRRFGRGVGSPAVLNYGDCLAYAVSASLGWPLLCVGNDFARTDVMLAR
ncbi:MAG: type II toxin-antitoxin system VapC family toxin [Gemmatimonas sp.]|jgi:ribonuclease VapC|uniref:type II toxin-antitoxin system VapC family toxin n=1 Tax=Gemmatimonas sp. TaxID=1962908 RepID=UPI0022CD080D|nr:type II toxin-antitoxin system VapC family toxin [Gemmatimonas sp.]MCA2984268.1 type II toxin-antitoxin system VapC family toxin [Gemmatimonas sp.]MCA2995017.1 type II toxin-antitoxin system VapC family toxin [Gemmatimonas sp.]MCZ8011010.1 type II toxin-antitoxin system VapC family toxin [Gemmatimonas sp.]MCZ8266169.1 type II toxin-antitoxin system VapC family toxin [Gemmatimonas sp.]